MPAPGDNFEFVGQHEHKKGVSPEIRGMFDCSWRGAPVHCTLLTG